MLMKKLNERIITLATLSILCLFVSACTISIGEKKFSNGTTNSGLNGGGALLDGTVPEIEVTQNGTVALRNFRQLYEGLGVVIPIADEGAFGVDKNYMTPPPVTTPLGYFILPFLQMEMLARSPRECS